MPKVTRQQVLAWVGYAAFFMTCFAIAAYFTFPYDRVRDLLVSRVAASGAPGSPAMKLTIGELGPHWLTGVILQSVVLERPASVEGEPGSRIELDELTVSVAPLALLLGRTKLAFSAELGDGEIDGGYEGTEAGPHHVEVELDAVDLGRLGAGGFLGVPLKGAMSGTVDVTVSDKPVETQGSIDLKFGGLRLGDGKSKVKVPGMTGGLTLESINAGKLVLKVAIKEGVATIEKMEGKGKDLELSGSGSVRIAMPVSLSRADITLGAKFSDAYKQRNERTKVVFELMDMNPLIKSATGADHMMRFNVSGAVSALRSAPASGGARIGARPRRARAAKAVE
jgi:type II secretion system protein N